MEQERAGFLAWLASVAGAQLTELKGFTKLIDYRHRGREVVLETLDANATRLKIDPRARSNRDRITTEVDASFTRLAEHQLVLAQYEREADAVLAEAYGLDAAQRARVVGDCPA